MENPKCMNGAVIIKLYLSIVVYHFFWVNQNLHIRDKHENQTLTNTKTLVIMVSKYEEF